MNNAKEPKFAILIDAENVPYSNIKGMLDEVSKYGTATTKRIYADWTKQNANGWKSVLLENAIRPIQQFSYTFGKNSSDSALIIDAMDLLYSDNVDGFCIVSSDSDFTRLAIRIRESGKMVIGIGERKTPNSFIVACDKFIFIEIIPPINSPNEPNESESNFDKNSILKIESDTIELIENALNTIADDEGWAFLGDVGNSIIRKKPSFDPKKYGFGKLTPLLKSLDILDFDERETDKKGIKHVFVRLKQMQLFGH